LLKRLTNLSWPPLGWIDWGDLRRTQPVCSTSTNAIGRYYTRTFLDACGNGAGGGILDEHGASMAICSDAGRRLGLSDLSELASLRSAEFDCIILPLSLQHAFDLHETVLTIHRLLKPGGLLIATLPGIARTQAPCDFWRFTRLSAEKVLREAAAWAEIEVRAYGNVLAAASALHGVPAHELSGDELNRHDPDYEVVIGVRAVREAL
jgi:hypothetical protein